MAIATTPTLLSLDRWAKIMGLNPLHFNGAAAFTTPGNQEVMPLRNRCEDIWYQYDWQYADQVGRESLARAIASAEQDVAAVLGYWPAPTWITNEVSRYPRYHRRDFYGTGLSNVRGQFIAVNTHWGKFIQGGRRKCDWIADVTGVESDADTDNYEETVTIEAVVTTTTNVCEIKIYVANHEGDPQWEIRPARTKTLVGTAFTATFWSWQFIDPAAWDVLPVGDEGGAIDITAGANLDLDVEVRREYNDYTEVAAELYWEGQPSSTWPSIACTCGGSGCTACAFTSQEGCLHVRDTDNGLVVPQPASYDADNTKWNPVCPTVCRNPDQVKMWYYAGEQDNRYLAGYDCDPMPQYLAEAIAWLATARLERPYCACGAITALAEDLRQDMSIVGEENISRFMDAGLLANPFGTRRGEIKAWQRIDQMLDSVGRTTGVAL